MRVWPGGGPLENVPSENHLPEQEQDSRSSGSNVEDESIIESADDGGPSITVDAGEPLPVLSADELATLVAEGQHQTETWFDLASMNKLIQPPALTDELQSFRSEWEVDNPAIAPFIGLWHDDGMSQLTYLVIFPAVDPDQVCILEFHPGWQVVEETFIEPVVILSTATISDGHLLGSRLRTHLNAAHTEIFFTGDQVALLDVVLTVDNSQRVFALKSPPALPQLPVRMVEAIDILVSQSSCTSTAWF